MYKVVIVARLKSVVLRIVLMAGLAMLIPFTSARAGSVNVSWNSSTDSGVAGYNVYYGTTSHNYSNVTPVGTNPSTVLPSLINGYTYFIAVTAVDEDGEESDFSDEVSYLMPGGNSPPTISSIADLAVVLNQSTPAIGFTVNDAESSASSLTVTATSSDTTLVPAGSIALGGSGQNRTVKVTPASGLTGSAQITVFVSDGLNTSSISFILTVQQTAPNNPPTISAIANQTVGLNKATAAIPFTVGDVESAASSLTLSATSGNTLIVPNGNIVLAGSGANRTVKVTPATGQSGNAQITVSVSDGANVTSTSFTLTVQPAAPNTAPTISGIANQTVGMNKATAVIPFMVGDAELSAASLTVSAVSSNTGLVPNGNIALGGSGASRTVKVTPATSQSGNALVTISVSDGTNTTSTSFTLTVQVPVNTAPTISAIANQTVSMNKATAAIPFTVGDTESSAASLTVSAASSNTGLVPNGNIVLGGSSASRTVKVTPATGQTGSALVTISVSDGTNTTSANFTLTVQASANTAPTISGINDQVVKENQATAAISFTVGDAETPAASLKISAASSNTSLVPNAGISLGGSGASHTVKVTPATGKTGNAQVTISVSDGTNSTSMSFTLTVQAPANTAPTISAIANQVINENQATAAISFTVGDAETSAASLTLSAASSDTGLVPNASIVLGGSGANRTVRVTPAAGQAGSAQITVSVNDGTTITSRTFTLTVQQTAANTPPTISTIPTQQGYTGNPTAAIPFTIGDAESPASSLTLSATSGDTTLVPDGNITFGGSAQNRTVTIIPAASQTGSVQITITVSDGNATAQTTFTLNIEQATALPKSNLAKSTTYNGLFYEDSSVRVQSAGAFKLTVTSAGKYSGSLQMADGTHAFTGVFGTFCQGANTILRKGNTPLTINFSLMGDNATNQFAGSLSDGVWAAPMHGTKAIFNSKTNPAPYAGNYTVAIPGQPVSSFSLGNGFGSIKVDGSGNVKLAGVLADGTKISQAAVLSKDGTWPMFVPLYKGKGLAIAWISFTNRAMDDLHGQINWIKQPDVTARYYPEGLAVAGDVVGSGFAPPSLLAFNLQVAALKSTGVGSGRITSLKVSASTGTFTGSLLNGITSVNIQGALLQKPNAGYGFFLGTDESMPVVLSP